MTFGDDTFYYTLKTLLVVLGTLGMMVSCTKIKYSYKKCTAVLLLYLGWIAAVSFLILRILVFLILLRLCFFLVSIPAMITLYYILEYSLWQTVFHYAMQLSIAIILAMSQTILFTLLGGGKLMDFCKKKLCKA